MTERAPVRDPFATLDRLAQALLEHVARTEGWGQGDISGTLARHMRVAAALDAALRPDVAPEDPEQVAAEILAVSPSLVPHVALLRRCAEALPQVLAGDIAGTDLMFPGGSMELVAPIYDGSEWADRFNRRTAEAVARAAVALAADRSGPVTIVEIGAGTGGTTRHVLPALQRARAAEGFDLAYHYTDISAGFLAHGRRCFGAEHSYLRFATLDVERDPAAQGLAAGTADVVVATNVLHATARIDETLAHVSALLRPGGMLVANEVTRASLFATMTFGLLDGWWRFEDADLRLPHSPLLDIAGWSRALERAGLAAPVAIGWDGETSDDFQALLIADRPAQAHVAPSRPHAAPVRPAGGSLRAVVTGIVADALGLAPGEVDPDRPLAELGVDSIVAGQLAAALTERLGVAVPASTLFDHATVSALSRHVETLGATISEVAGAPVAPAEPALIPEPAAASDDIAIIGMACRFPGAPDLEAFWRNLAGGVDSITERSGGYLDDHDAFDPEVFRLTPSEAQAMSPQQRVFLECAWHTLEHAGYGGQDLSARSVGVYVGVAPDGYGDGRSDARSSLGDSNAILSARLSYALNLNGPCLPIDTACSSSLVAVHMAARAVAQGDAEMALAGGVSILMRGPRLPAFLSDSGMASPTGRCHTFDAAADGFVPGEGVGAVLLKRLDRARADGDSIVAVLKGSGVNHDGRTSGITAPSGPAQTALISQVMSRAGLDPATIGYVEAHGTGTRLGDPIEVNALTRAYGTSERPCWIGSVKTNIGHTLCAAGIAGLIKAALAVQRGQVPPSLNYRTQNPELDLTTGRFRVPTDLQRWAPANGALRRAAVSSFGFSGTNAHAVVEQPPARVPVTETGGRYPVFFSARSEAALDAMLARIGVVLADDPPPFPAIAFTLTAGRTHFEHRAAVMAGSVGELRAGIEDLKRMAPGETVSGKGRAITSNSVPHAVEADPVAAFLAGAELDLVGLFPPQARQRVPLPAYPFQHVRFQAPKTAPAPSPPVLHPLIAENVSDASGLGWRLADGWSPLKDHRSHGAAIVPASAMLEIMHAAARLALGVDAVEIVGLSLLAPLAVADLPRAHVCLADTGNGWSVAILDGDGHTSAEASLETVEDGVPEVEALSGGGRILGADAVYAALAGVGFDYGPEFRTVEQVEICEDQVIATLAPVSAEGFAWPPSLVDGAIQSAVGLALDRFAGRQVTVIPAGLERARLLGGLQDARYAIVRERAPADADRITLDIAITDAAGRCLARIDGLSAAVVEQAESGADAVLAFAPRWVPVPETAPAVEVDGATVIITAPGQRAPQGLLGAVIETPEDWEGTFARLDPAPEWLVDLRGLAVAEVSPTAQMTGLLAGWLRARPGVPLSILRVHDEDGGIDPDEAALEGLAVTLPHEAPEVSLRLLGLGRGAGPVDAAIRVELHQPASGTLVRRIAGRRHTRRWEAVGIDAEGAEGLPDRPVVLITGAHGGLGSAVAMHLARTRRARLVLAGRRERGAASALAAAVVGAGGEAIDVAADIATASGAAEAVAAACSDFGRLDAIVHAAGVTGDQLLRNQTPGGVAEILAPKLGGVRALMGAAREQPLRAVVCFGSLAARFGNAGQGVYAAANAAIGALGERDGAPLTVVDWPYWHTGGMTARDENDARLRAATGSRWITEAEGLALLDRVLAIGPSRLAVAAGDPARVTAAFTGQAGEVRPAVPATVPAQDPARALPALQAILSDVTGIALDRLEPGRTIEDLGLDSMHVMTLNRRLETRFNGVPPTLFYAHRTIGAAAAALADLSRSTAPAAPARPRLPAALASQRPVPPRRHGDGAAPIAIIGIAGRFPGAPDLDAFWELLRAGRDAVTEIPADRWDVARYHDDRPGQPGRSYSRWGGFIDGVEMFDPVHFGIAPADAVRMDPQERLILEVAAEALDDAGLTRASLVPDAGRRGSVHIGVMYGDYQMLGADQHARGNPVAASAPYWSIANRLSYWLDLHGPSFAVDSACSSSLTAIHLACQALWTGEADIALAGGVNLSLHPLKYIGLSQGRFASTDGRCRSFAEGGDGYVPGEGVGIVVLKPLAEAEAAGDPIHGVIRGSAVTHGGRTNGYTVPSPDAQAAAITAAWTRAGIAPDRLGYLEAHGTGTALGDPIELDGIGRAIDARNMPLPIGTVKASIGHLEAAAGIAGLAKVLMQFRHNTLAPTLLHGTPSKALSNAGDRVRLVTEVEAWPAGEMPRLAGISSFGAGGANAHLLVEEPPPPTDATEEPAGPFAFVFSGRSRAQLEAEVDRLLPVLAGGQGPARSADIARTLQIGREALSHRVGVLADTTADAARSLAAWRGGKPSTSVMVGLPDDDSLSRAVAAPTAGASLADTAAAWVAGAEIEWRALDLPGRRLRLPPRPLLRKRYWPEIVDAPAAASDPDVGSTTFIAIDDPVLGDHRVQGACLLPGAASLILLAGVPRRALRDVRFRHPGRPGADGLRLAWSMGPDGVAVSTHGATIASAVVGGEGAEDNSPIGPVATGMLVDTDEIYGRFQGLGIDYGPLFRRLSVIRSDGRMAEGRLVPLAGVDDRTRAISDLDAAMQVAIALAPGDLDRAGVPASVEAVTWGADAGPAVLVRARRVSDDGFDLDAIDGSGRSAVRLRGLRVRPMGLQAAPTLAPRMMAPVWEEVATACEPTSPGRVLLAQGIDGTGFTDRLRERLSPVATVRLDGFDGGLEDCDTVILVGDLASDRAGDAARAMALTDAAGAFARTLAAGGDGPKRMVVITARCCDPEGTGAVDPVNGGLAGLARSLAEEVPGMTLSLVDLDPAALDDPATLDRVLAEPSGPLPVARVAWRGDRRFVERLADFDLEAAPRSEGLPDRPVCLITGGSGGLGLALARHLVATRGARVVLSGRRATLDGALPQGATYRRGDAADRTAIDALCAGIVGEHGRLDAVFHLPLVLRDGRLASMSAQDFSAPLVPKAIGTANVMAAAEAAGAGTAIVFSSANVFAGVAGQANYVAASGLQDALALAHRGHMRVQVIDWGLWGEVGAVADAGTQRRLLRAGIHPIAPAQGLRLLDAILDRDVARVAVVAAEPGPLARLGWRGGADLGDDVAAFKRLETYGLARVAGDLAAILGTEAGRAFTPAALDRKLKIAPRHRPLFAALLEALIRRGFAGERDGVVRLPAPDLKLDAVHAEAEAALADAPAWLAGPRALLDAVLAVYPEILAGRVDPLSAMFPGGRGDLVAAAYRDNPVSDGFNTVAAEAVRAAAGPGAVVVEVGGGTGGGTVSVIAALDRGPVPARYVFTDISRRFLDAATGTFGATRPWFETALYDAEQPVEANGMAPGAADVVIATNMLHAVADLPAALRELGRLLKPTGTLVINELVENQDYGTLVFGLTEGWWKGAGASDRLPHGPVVDAAGWRRVLEAGGFRDVRVDDLSARGGRGQAVITATPPPGVRDARTVSRPLAAPPSAEIVAVGEADDGLRRALIADLRGIIAGQLALDPQELGASRSFDSFGLESLSAMAIRDTLDARFGGVSQTLLFEHDTLASLADHLLATRGAEVRSVLAYGGEEAAATVVDPPGLVRPQAGHDPAAPIAVIGLAGRFPGADTVEALWRLIEGGGSALGPVPADRWRSEDWFDPRGGPGRSYTRTGGFLAGIDRFDPLYFGMSPAEAESIDPQERLFLETAWHALESAGSTAGRLQARSGPVGVFVGVMNSGYQWLAAERARDDAMPATSSYWSIANRLSYVADWNGPSLAVDTACSSSLTALHLAVEALRRDECGAAVVGGVNLIVHPRQLANLSQARMLSPSGDCRAFGEGADGFVDGEGVAALVLKPLDAALRDGDRVEAVIRGTALNAGGRTSGFSVPSPVAQGDVAAEALARAGIDPASVQAVETHGTGTSLGDPIEVSGLAAAYGGADRAEPLVIGALKANIGHLESAAGVAGVVKAVLQLRHRRIAPLRHAASLNPRIDLAGSGLSAPAVAIDWPAPAQGPRRIAVSSFGAGGANAHAVLEEAPTRVGSADGPVPDLLILSAMDDDGLRRSAAALREGMPEGDLARICHSLRVGRRALGCRMAVPVRSVAELRDALGAVGEGRLPPGAVIGDGTGAAARMLEESAAGRAFLAEKLASGDLVALARLWVDGAEIDWDGLPWTDDLIPIDLPGTAFARERYWLDEEPARVEVADTDTPARFLVTAWHPAPAASQSTGAAPWILTGGPRELASGALAHEADPPMDRLRWDRLVDRLPVGAGGDLVVLAGDDVHTAALAALGGLGAVMARPGRVRRVFLAARSEAVATVLAAAAASAGLEGLDGRVRTVILPTVGAGAALAAERQVAAPGAPLIDLRTARAIRVRRAIEAPQGSTPAIGKGSRVLLVGGLGAVGTALARELVSVRGARVGVIGRRTASDGEIPADLDIAYAAGDLADAASLSRAVAEIRASLGGIDAVLDLARLVDNAPLAAKDPARSEAVLAVKTRGTVALDRATRGDPLSAFVVFSSLAAWFGLAGGADYAAACAAQDALMADREGPGRSLSVAWPQWEYDRELTPARRAELQSAGLATIDAAQGLALLDRALAGDARSLAIAVGRGDILDALAEDVDAAEGPDTDTLSDADLLAYVERLRAEAGEAVPPAAPKSGASSAAAIAAALAKHLKVDPARLAATTAFADLGLDSIKALHVAESLATALAIEVEPVLLVAHPTVAELTRELDARREEPLREAGE